MVEVGGSLEAVLDEGQRAVLAVRTQRPAVPPREDRLLAGVSEVDITPPPGLPKAGYSANARDGQGFRTRLKARVIHLRAGTASLALVQCDLLSGSSVLHRFVADRLALRCDVALSGLMIGATHTHAGPGQFLGSDFYNRFASNRPGFDPRWAKFLVDQISDGVLDAAARREPARLALGSTDVWGLTRNRSLEPHVANSSVTDERLDPQRKFAAINPDLHLLRVDSERTGPLGAMIVFSVHGTGISMRSTDYHADLWAHVVGEARSRIERLNGTRVVVGAIEGTHADLAPDLRPGQAGHVEARRIGAAIGREAALLHGRLGTELSGDVGLGEALTEFPLGGDHAIDGVRVADRPAVGVALVAGAHENTTPVIHRLPPFRPGFPRRRSKGRSHGAKRVLGGGLQRLVVPPSTFPDRATVQILRLGNVALVGVPFEVTVESGRRLAAAVEAELPGASAVVSSVANGYLGYLATEEEYALQHYEGGHTLYGPNSSAYVAKAAARLAARLSVTDRVADHPVARSWALDVARYLPAPVERTGRPASSLGPPVFTDATATRDAYWEFRWRDDPPSAIDWHHRLVAVEQEDAHAWWRPARHDHRDVDDGGEQIGVRHLGGESDGLHVYSARWHAPQVRAGRRHRFVIFGPAGVVRLRSAPVD